MTKITIYSNNQKEYTGFKSEGHAGYAEDGQDIVCAAISALVINTVNSIEKLTSDKFKINSNEKKGIIEIRFNNKISDKSILLMDSLALGLTKIENDYGHEYIKVIFKEV